MDTYLNICLSGKNIYGLISTTKVGNFKNTPKNNANASNCVT